MLQVTSSQFLHRNIVPVRSSFFQTIPTLPSTGIWSPTLGHRVPNLPPRIIRSQQGPSPSARRLPSEGGRSGKLRRSSPLRIFIADDHGLLRAGLRALLKDEPNMEVVGEAADGNEALALVDKVRPDVILADISMPGPSGIEIAERLRASSPQIRVLIMTMHEDRHFVENAMQAGAAGYLVKRAAEDELVKAIMTVANGERYIYADLAEPLPSAGGEPETAAPPVTAQLTSQETEVLRGLVEGKTNQQIAHQLYIDVQVVIDTRSSLSEKLGLRSRLELLTYARRVGLI
jgi:DNA-binding NarL/FixJ family response regulator